MKISFNKFLKKIFPLFSVVLYTGPLFSCAAAEDLYSKQYNTENSQYTPQIMNKTLTLKFEYSSSENTSVYSNVVWGTGWIWSVKGNSYYVATNMHVAASVNFKNTKFYQYSNSSYHLRDYSNVSQIKSSIGFYNGHNSENNSYVNVSTPTVVYTTINDTKYNAAFNSTNTKSYSSSSGGQSLNYWGVTDITILKYEINMESYSSSNQDFYNWLKAYSSNPTSVYGSSNENANPLDLTRYTYYSGGFPKVSDPSITNSIMWEPVSDFKLNNEVTNAFGETWNKDTSNSIPITFIDETFANKNNNSSSTTTTTDNSLNGTLPTVTKDYSSDKTSTNFLNVSYTGYFYGHSDEGSSGSMLATVIDGKLQVVGIYWGVSVFRIGNNEVELGSYDIFVTSKFNIAYNIQQAINNDTNSSTITNI
ncbi:hypothetical protein D8X55_03935 [Malacoplasma penetrans]|nr:hypothetical protein [Malacoplasma penetrans]RXY96377.1 hypothetical protein D8X55_03935 [Malacoplasma penetrans]